MPKYIMQVQRTTSQEDCVPPKTVLFGYPVEVDASCDVEATRKAAVKFLLRPHDAGSYYHLWLEYEKDGRDIGPTKFNPVYSWSVINPRTIS